MRRRLLACLAVGLTVTLAACGPDGTQLDDAPVGIVDDTPQFVMTNLDGFPNVAVRCYGGNGIYTTTREYGDAITIIVADPECVDGDPTPEGD